MPGGTLPIICRETADVNAMFNSSSVLMPPCSGAHIGDADIIVSSAAASVAQL